MYRFSRWIPLFFSMMIGLFALSGCDIIAGMTTGPLPKQEGTLKAAGLTAPVEVLRDRWGVPHIYAKNSHDLFFAQGFTHAQDRWWQMELYRHVGKGTLSEMLGEATLSSDIYLRTLRLYDTAQKEEAILDAETHAAVEAFAAGVNAYISSRPPMRLAIEYAALALTGTQIEVTPWTVADSIVFGKIIQMQQSAPSNDEDIVASVLEKVGMDRLKYWMPPLPYGVKPTILQQEDLKSATSGASILENLIMRPALGSNSWIAAGSQTVTGRPILENDPHLGVSTPSLYYEIALHSEGNENEAPIDAAGVAFSPFLGVAIGHNATAGWGITIGKGVDAWDTYEIHPNPAAPPAQYEWNGGWRDYTLRTETFNIAGAAPVTVTIRETLHGPIINDTLVQDASGTRMTPSDKPLALRWVGLEPTELCTALYQLLHVKSFDDFHKALSHWTAPSCNLSYADTAGNIGYQLTGKAPIRAKDHTGLIPAPGWTDASLWKGFIDYEDFPKIYNPDRGLIIHTNQAVAPPEFFDRLSGKYGNDVNTYFQATAFYGYRAGRLDTLLTGKAPYSLDDFAKVQADIKLDSVNEVMDYLRPLKIADTHLFEMRNWLLKWDRRFSVDSKAATYYWLFWMRLMKNIYLDEAPAPEPRDGIMYAIRLLLQEPKNEWWDDKATADVVEDRDTILVRSLQEAEDDLYSRYGDDSDDWAWGKCHYLKFVNNPLGVSGIGVIEAIVNRGPYPIGGTEETVNLAEGVEQPDGTFSVQWAPCMRMILDVGAWDNSLIDLTPGQSGHPASGNYSDQIKPWLAVEHRKMAWSRESVEASSTKRLLLAP